MATVDDFKNVMSHWTTGISVITTTHEGNMIGFTANSFASVSIEPLLISMSMTKTLRVLPLFEASGTFAINILSAQQANLGMRFAGMLEEFRDDRFQGLSIEQSENGNPLLPDTIGYLDCTVYQTVDVGASTLFLGEVQAATVQNEEAPLAYFLRQWGTFQPTTA